MKSWSTAMDRNSLHPKGVTSIAVSIESDVHDH